MKVGLYTDLRNPPQSHVPWPEFYARRLERMVEAERMGFGAAWVSEHHMFEDGYLPQTLTFLAALAARTNRMRLGTAILLAPLRPSLQIAEEAAIVDLISGGRLELGLGAGYHPREFTAYGADIRQRYRLLEDRIVETRRMWEDGTCTPPPAQARVPIWIGAMGPRGARIAGRLGEGLLWLDPQLLAPYRAALLAAGHDPASARIGGLAFVVLADDPDEARVRIAPHLAYQRETYNRYAAIGTQPGAPSLAANTVQAGDHPVDGQRLIDTQGVGVPLPPRLRIMRPEDATTMLRDAFAGLPVEHVLFWDSIAGMPEDLAERHVELLAQHMVPALQDG